MEDIVTITLTRAGALEELCGGDPAVVRQLVNVFLRTFADDLASLENAVGAGERSTAAAFSHRMAGSALAVGAEGTAQRLKSFSGLMAEPGAHIDHAMWQALRQELARVLQEVSTFG